MVDTEAINTVNKDFTIPEDIEDTISQIKFYPKGNYLASAGWDARIKIWNVNYQVNNSIPVIGTQLIYNTQLQDPILSLAWRTEPIALFAGIY